MRPLQTLLCSKGLQGETQEPSSLGWYLGKMVYVGDLIIHGLSCGCIEKDVFMASLEMRAPLLPHPSARRSPSSIASQQSATMMQ